MPVFLYPKFVQSSQIPNIYMFWINRLFFSTAKTRHLILKKVYDETIGITTDFRCTLWHNHHTGTTNNEYRHQLGPWNSDRIRITSYNVCYTKLLRFTAPGYAPPLNSPAVRTSTTNGSFEALGATSTFSSIFSVSAANDFGWTGKIV